MRWARPSMASRPGCTTRGRFLASFYLRLEPDNSLVNCSGNSIADETLRASSLTPEVSGRRLSEKRVPLTSGAIGSGSRKRHRT